jgi:hypothetical protein
MQRPLMERVAYRSGPWNEVRRDAMQTAYKHAAQNPDLYRACLSDARTRQAYLSILNRYVEQNFRERLKAVNKQPRIPVPVMARGFVGHTLSSWTPGWPASSRVTSKSSPAWPWTFSSPAEPGRRESASTNSDTKPDHRPMPVTWREQQQRQGHAILSLPALPRPRMQPEKHSDARRSYESWRVRPGPVAGPPRSRRRKSSA